MSMISVAPTPLPEKACRRCSIPQGEHVSKLSRIFDRTYPSNRRFEQA